jgi:hypothetical protein
LAPQKRPPLPVYAPFDSFNSQKQLAELAASWPAERLVAIWNSLAGVVAVESFKSPKAAVSRIWARIQRLAEPAKPTVEPEKPKAHKKAKGGAQAAKGASAKAKATRPGCNFVPTGRSHSFGNWWTT